MPLTFPTANAKRSGGRFDGSVVHGQGEIQPNHIGNMTRASSLAQAEANKGVIRRRSGCNFEMKYDNDSKHSIQSAAKSVDLLEIFQAFYRKTSNT